jgi:4,5-dihydroxyphthalate decarboxylase
VMIPKTLGTTVRRLFSDPRKVEREYYERTRIFPIMHTFVLKKALYDENPWLAISFYRAFCRARDIAYYWMNDTDALTVGLPWVIDELEATRKIFGPQIWDYSIEGSRPTLDALVRHLDEQKLTRRKMTVEELFVTNIAPGLAEYLHATGED